MRKKLLLIGNFVVISGAEVSRIEKQMDGVPCIKMGQNGNDTPDWKNLLKKSEKKEILKHIEKIQEFLECEDCGSNTTEDRGCQISFSFTGHNADVRWKKKFDPNQEYRKWVLKINPFKSKKLMLKIAGTTCYDYNRKGCSKGDNLKRYMKLHKLNPKDCVYYGDALFKGGNDESVMGVMKCIKVKNPDDLYGKL